MHVAGESADLPFTVKAAPNEPASRRELGSSPPAARDTSRALRNQHRHYPPGRHTLHARSLIRSHDLCVSILNARSPESADADTLPAADAGPRQPTHDGATMGMRAHEAETVESASCSREFFGVRWWTRSQRIRTTRHRVRGGPTALPDRQGRGIERGWLRSGARRAGLRLPPRLR